MTAQQTVTLELDDIQAAVLSPRPAPYAGAAAPTSCCASTTGGPVGRGCTA